LELFDADAFGRQPAAGEGGRGAIELAFIVDDVERARQRLEAADVSCGPVLEERWGRFAWFRDPERNQLQIFELLGPGGDG
jgi:predicted enzyme related to lactoylglutathione lyase